MGNLTNSVEKGFSQPWEPLSDALENKREQRQGFERTNFFFSFFSSQSSQLEGAQKNVVSNLQFCVFEEKCEIEPILNKE
jgi:hypothetical protein